METLSSEWVCYILQSLNPKHQHATYVGITNNMTKRIRQHNGEIVGGAKKTSKKRPWGIVGIFFGFADKTTVLQFEWRIHHPPNSRMVKSRRGKIIYKYPSNMYGLDGRLNVISLVLNLKQWTSNSPLSAHVKLTLIWYRTGLSLPTNLCTHCTQTLHPQLI